MTFSIVASDPKTGEVGVAVQSKYFCVGSVVPWAKAGVGAVATQAAGVAVYGPRILERLEAGDSPSNAIDFVLADDDERAHRQLGVVDAKGAVASWTGESCNPWAGAFSGEGYTAQGNILAGEAVVKEMARAYETTEGDMAERLAAALEAGQAAGGDTRGQQSAALIVERTGAASERREGIDRVVDLRVDDHIEPIAELRRLLGVHTHFDFLRRAFVHYQAKEYVKGIELLSKAHGQFPQDAMILYDLACYESLAGRKNDAIAHLGKSLYIEPKYRESAKGDTDFDPIREEKMFSDLVG